MIAGAPRSGVEVCCRDCAQQTLLKNNREGETLNWTTALVILAVVVLAYAITRARQISSQDALALLKNGALVIDVRSSAEFNSGHLPKAINIPLEEIEIVLPRRVKDASQVLLLHCQSGMRSGAAKTKLKNLGYANAFNLGSYARASHIVSAK
jgi:rhodanese-related sulfurtransferase